MLLVDLPGDVLLAVCQYLPLTAILVFRLQICRTLRYHPELCRLRLPSVHTLSFSEWQIAAGELQKFGLARSDYDDDDDDDDEENTNGLADQGRQVPPPLPKNVVGGEEIVGWNGAKSLSPRIQKLDVAIQAMISHGPAKEARLFRRVLAFLGLVPPSHGVPPQRQSPAGLAVKSEGTAPRRFRLPTPLEERLQPAWVASRSLKSISAACWNGISGDLLVHLLKTEPTLGSVELIIKTERWDSDAWKTIDGHSRGDLESSIFCADDFYDADGRPQALLGDRFRAAIATPSVNPDPTLPFALAPPAPYTNTQVVAHMGLKAPKGVTVGGHGLYAGYPAFCYVPSQESMQKPGARDAVSETNAATVSAAPSHQGLHVVFVGRFHAEDAIKTEDSFRFSTLRCSSCRKTLEWS